jgi:hydrogenase maturation protein HypF
VRRHGAAASLDRVGDPVSPLASGGAERLRLEVHGAVQGVGFRPHVYRLARELELAGWVLNGTGGVVIEVEGPARSLAAFGRRLLDETPPAAVVHSAIASRLPAVGEHDFRIVSSSAAETKSAVVLPDLATCPDCLREVLDPADRRHRYPFTNCTNCGPRFSILHDLPYDRERTTMRGFRMCDACRTEYEDPLDRRFHAQPVACPDCGPQLALTDADGRVVAARDEALVAAAGELGAGRIVALKGLGGYQLLVDARDSRAVAELRARKRRPAKPLAVLVADLVAARRIAEISPEEEALLVSPRAPIVLLAERSDSPLARGVAPGTPNVGLLLPTTPLHHLLARETGFPLVCTSGNLSDEPIAIGDEEARIRLGRIADLFLAHDRPVARHVDDGVAWIADGAPQPLRRARGEAPLPVLLAEDGPTLVAVGAHQKDVAALALGRQVFLSQHLGDMETPEAHAAFERVVLDFLRLYEAVPAAIAHDLHPDYPTTRWAIEAARAEGGLLARAGHPPAELALVAVQHHHAHFAAALAEHGHTGPALGITWDGTGFGPDGTVWGGEWLLGDATGFARVARLRPFRLPGGEAAVRAPWRVALALLDQLDADVDAETLLPRLASLSAGEQRILRRMIAAGLRSPWTSSAGRLFDGVAAIAGIADEVSYEGEAAMRLEHVADAEPSDPYPHVFTAVDEPPALAPAQRPHGRLLELDWRPLLRAVVADRARGISAPTIAARFHATLADGAVEIARRVGADAVALTGGCFQNRRLTREICARLRADGRRPPCTGACRPTTGGSRSARWPWRGLGWRAEKERREPCVSEFPAEWSTCKRTPSAFRTAASTSAAWSRRSASPTRPTPRSASTWWSTSASPSRRSTRTRRSASSPTSPAPASSARSSASRRLGRRPEPVRFVDEYRDQATARRSSPRSSVTPPGEWTLMEICGGQTHTMLRSGIDRMLPRAHHPRPRPRLPGLRHAARADRPRARHRAAAGGDLLLLRRHAARAGIDDDLLKVKARGRRRADRLLAARRGEARAEAPRPRGRLLRGRLRDHRPANAMAVAGAKAEGLANFSLLVSHVLVPPAIEAILSSPGNRVQGFLAAGHVCAVMGYREYEPLAASYRSRSWSPASSRSTCCKGILAAVEGSSSEGEARVENQYPRGDVRDGNRPRPR